MTDGHNCFVPTFPRVSVSRSEDATEFSVSRQHWRGDAQEGQLANARVCLVSSQGFLDDKGPPMPFPRAEYLYGRWHCDENVHQ